MSLQNIPLDRIGEADIQRLLSMGVTESVYLDYKQETYGDAGNDGSEFLADISSFANTLGGDLVIGVAEANGLPTSLTPFAGDCDAEKRRLEQVAISGLEPRVSNLRIHSVPIKVGGHVIIVRVPRSFIPPHRVIARDSNRFWARAGTMKYQPNVEQLRHELRSDDGVNSRFIGGHFTRLIVTHVRQYLQVLKFYEMGLPVYIFLSFCSGAKTVYRYASPEGFGWHETKPLGREIAAFPEIYVDNFDVDVSALMRPEFNVVWNAFGLAQCEIYDENGKLRGVS